VDFFLLAFASAGAVSSLRLNSRVSAPELLQQAASYQLNFNGAGVTAVVVPLIS